MHILLLYLRHWFASLVYLGAGFAQENGRKKIICQLCWSMKSSSQIRDQFFKIIVNFFVYLHFRQNRLTFFLYIWNIFKKCQIPSKTETKIECIKSPKLTVKHKYVTFVTRNYYFFRSNK